MKILARLAVAKLLLLSALGALAQGSNPTLQVIGTFQLPSTTVSFSPSGIGQSGVIVGSYSPKSGPPTLGFLRDERGRYVSLAYPGAYETFASGVNATSTVCGTYFDSQMFPHGWFYAAGSYSSFDYPGAFETFLNGINDAGDFVGNYATSSGDSGPFLDMGGTVIPFDPGVGTDATATGISSNGLITGSYYSGSTYESFIRETDGSFITGIQVPQDGVFYNLAAGINNQGYVVGSFRSISKGNSHEMAFVFQAPDTYILYSYPGSANTYFTGINDQNQIVGWYTTPKRDRKPRDHGLILQLEDSSREASRGK
ncbi:MAG TPA: hypothetical protein VGG02_00410 [Chthoniobacterales bacterium]|jgi:uncharacterized membrane protein